MNDITMDIGRFKKVNMNLSKMDSTTTIEIGIPVNFLSTNWKLKTHIIAENIGKENGWTEVNHSQDESYISIDLFGDSVFNPNTEITYRLFVTASPMNPEEEKPEYESVRIMDIKPTDEEKKIFKSLMIGKITEQIMEG